MKNTEIVDSKISNSSHVGEDFNFNQDEVSEEEILIKMTQENTNIGILTDQVEEAKRIRSRTPEYEEISQIFNYSSETENAPLEHSDEFFSPLESQGLAGNNSTFDSNPDCNSRLDESVLTKSDIPGEQSNHVAYVSTTDLGDDPSWNSSFRTTESNEVNSMNIDVIDQVLETDVGSWPQHVVNVSSDAGIMSNSENGGCENEQLADIQDLPRGDDSEAQRMASHGIHQERGQTGSTSYFDEPESATTNQEDHVSDAESQHVDLEPPVISKCAKSLFDTLKFTHSTVIRDIIKSETCVNEAFSQSLGEAPVTFNSPNGFAYEELFGNAYKIVLKSESSKELAVGNTVIGDIQFYKENGELIFGSSYCATIGVISFQCAIRDLLATMSVGEVTVFVVPLSYFVADTDNEFGLIQISVSVLLADTISQLIEEDIVFICTTKNDVARASYNANDIDSARRNYIDAITLIESCSSEVKNLEHVDFLLYKMLNNLASCEMANSKYQSAVSLSSVVIKRFPHNYKAVRRKAIGLCKLSYYQEAITILEESLTWSEQDHVDDINKTLAFVRSKKQQSHEDDKEFFKKGLGKFTSTAECPVEVAVSTCSKYGWVLPALSAGLLIGGTAILLYYRLSR